MLHPGTKLFMIKIRSTRTCCAYSSMKLLAIAEVLPVFSFCEPDIVEAAGRKEQGEQVIKWAEARQCAFRWMVGWPGECGEWGEQWKR